MRKWVQRGWAMAGVVLFASCAPHSARAATLEAQATDAVRKAIGYFQTQSALRFMMRMDRALEFKDAAIHEAVVFGGKGVLGAQYPNGAWPQVFTGPPDPEAHPIKPASFPRQWPRTHPGQQGYWYRYTLNDNVPANLIETIFEAERIYATSADASDRALARECRTAAERGGGFIVRAQLPEPQPSWAQQYDFEKEA